MKKLVALMLALTLCLSVFAFAGAEEPITLKIAHIGPLTGAAAVYGTATSRGAKIAADENHGGNTLRKAFVTPAEMDTIWS